MKHLPLKPTVWKLISARHYRTNQKETYSSLSFYLFMNLALTGMQKLLTTGIKTGGCYEMCLEIP